jgi:hypothetical protein
MSVIKCKNCKNDVIPKISGWQIAGVVLLFLFFCLPGILYLAYCYKKKCPICKNSIYSSPTNFPNKQNNLKSKESKKTIDYSF